MKPSLVATLVVLSLMVGGTGVLATVGGNGSGNSSAANSQYKPGQKPPKCEPQGRTDGTDPDTGDVICLYCPEGQTWSKIHPSECESQDAFFQPKQCHPPSNQKPACPPTPPNKKK